VAAKLWSTGPVAVFIKHALDAGPMFLGHGEKAPDIRDHGAYKNVHTDLSGDQVPHDKLYGGQDVTVTFTLSRFSQDALNILKARGRSVSVPAITPGYDPPGAMGSLAATEQACFEMWLAFYYSVKAPYVGMPPGYHFFQCVLDDETEQQGTQDVRKAPLTISTIRRFNAAESNVYGYGSWTAFDHQMGAIAGVAIS
jgi:hypothetical protein